MKKLLILWALVMVAEANACDVCNCGPGASLMGFTPIKAKWTVLNTTRWQRFRPISAEGSSLESNFIQNNLGVLYRERWGSVQLNLPYRVSNTEQTVATQSGFGDVMLGAGKNWQLGSAISMNTGLGIQFPTGKSSNLNWYQQPGMGNYRLLFSVNASYQATEKSGWIANYSYDPFLASTNDLRVGASHNLGVGFWQTMPVQQSSLTLMMGCSAYRKQEDIIRNFRQQFSGGRALQLDAQVVVSNRKISLGLGGSLPLAHNINRKTVQPLPTVQLQLGYYLM